MRGTGRGLFAVGVALVGLMVLLAVAAPLISRYDPAAQGVGPALAGPSVEHWLGTDRFGRDLAARVLHGGRTTLLATAAALALVVSVGTLVGAAVAAVGSIVDRLARPLFDLLVAFPVMVVALALVGLWGPSLGTALAGVLIVLWAPFARLSRSLVRTALAEPSAVAARALGAGRLRLLRYEVWPRLRGPVLVLAAVEAAQLIGVVAGLSFLGLGAQPPSAEWGAMLQEGRAALWSAPHLVLAPGIAVLVTVLGLTCMAEGLRDMLDRAGQVVPE
ncbi:ABC transporter permease [Phytohabitans aurantiacus]|uniref:Peptide ABC transporter substrate-binding protein n=1 Tax=Phytohabitans aurantiacus TaxID=3016789 RepID=A0ABQ5RB36_9ACTN|nr:ABC transporter permease [Phytohabitans aurantiacus]GLI03610.1 peptide ABC transporter substrate-binding protein [Phytohabitans aurantiacus]